MASCLLAMIYLAFISLGLPDSLLGSAWPSMYPDLGAGVSWAGIVSMIIAAGTIVSSLASDRLTRTLGTGRVTAFSVLMTAAALLGFSFSSSFWMLCLCAIPYGLGAGSVDAALNNFVALHYPARHMSWLHCMWGIGASVGPMIMGWAITGGLRWNGGYQIIAVIQIILTALLFLTLPLWKMAPAPILDTASDTAKAAVTEANNSTTGATADKSGNNAVSAAADASGNHPAAERLTFFQILRRRGIKEVLICFFCYSAMEGAAGMWAASYCTIERGITAEQAAQWASLFYLGITAGRFICGFITLKFNDRNMIRIGQVTAAIGLICVILPFGNTVLLAGLILIGCGCAPIYPSIIHETPANFGRELSQAVIGIQMAAAYTGTCLIPPLFGMIAEHVSFALYPYFLGIILLLMILMSEKLHLTLQRARRHRRS